MSLTFVNQVGAVNGMNQASPGSFIPETFVRWSQDILYDRVGQLRRRAPYKTLALFNEVGSALAQPDVDEQRVIGVVNTRNPNNENRIGIIVTDGTTTRVLFYDSNYRKTCFCTIATVRQDTIVFSRPALGGGVFIGLLENYGIASASNKNLLYYWRGGTGEGDYSVSGCTLGVTNATPITGDYTHSNNTMTTASAHGLQAGYRITITDVGDGGAGTPFTLNNVYTVAATGLTSTAFEIVESLSNDDSDDVAFVVATHTTYTNRINGTFDTSKLSFGMFVYREVSGTEDRYLGVVKDWATDGSWVDLEKDIIRTYGYEQPAYVNTAANVRFVNIRPYVHSHGRGLITREATTTSHSQTVTSGTVGSEGEGHFASADLAGTVSGTRWALYRASDGKWIGDVASVTNNAALTLSSAAHSNNVAMNADEYVARPYRAIYTDNDPDKYTGCFNTTYAGYQWFGNGGTIGTENRIVFSSYHDPESVDLSKDAADSIIIPGTQQMRGIATSASGLLIFLEDKTYMLRGNYRSNFSLEELYPEGCLSAQSIVEYGGGVFWAAKSGILFYDGATVRNLTENNLGAYYTDSISTFDAMKRRIYGFLYKDYLFMTFTGFNSSYKPLRYEPRYSSGYGSTPAVEGFPFDQYDPDFTGEDFNPINNVPVYWEPFNMYSSLGANAAAETGTWTSGKSYANADVSGTTVTNLVLDSYEIIDTSLTDNVATIEIDVTSLLDNKHSIKVDDVIRVDIDFGGDTTFDTNVSVVTAVTDTTVSYALTNANISATSDSGDVIVAPGLYVVGEGIPAGNTINTITDATELEMTNAATLDSYGYQAYDSNPIVNVPRSSFQIIPSIDDEDRTIWDSSLSFVWGPINFVEAMTFAIYLPTSAITAISNFDFRGFIKLDSVGGTRGFVGVNAVNPTDEGPFISQDQDYVYARLVDVDSMLSFNNDHDVTTDSELTENLGKSADLYYKGPDFYLQTKHYTVGDPVLRKWFRQIMLNLYLLDGGVRLDVVDMEDNDRIDIQKKRRRNWDFYEEARYSWDEFESIILPKLLSPDRSEWQKVQEKNVSWYEASDAEFTRRKKKISWRYPSAGFRLYQMNDFRPGNYQTPQRPHTVVVDSWNIGFKPMRTSRV